MLPPIAVMTMRIIRIVGVAMAIPPIIVVPIIPMVLIIVPKVITGIVSLLLAFTLAFVLILLPFTLAIVLILLPFTLAFVLTLLPFTLVRAVRLAFIATFDACPIRVRPFSTSDSFSRPIGGELRDPGSDSCPCRGP